MLAEIVKSSIGTIIVKNNNRAKRNREKKKFNMNFIVKTGAFLYN